LRGEELSASWNFSKEEEQREEELKRKRAPFDLFPPSLLVLPPAKP
jgi:hypothetical protein